MTRTTWIAAILGGLAALAATQSCASPEAQTAEVGQEADGCGAWRYRGSANVDCRYQGQLLLGNNDTGSCLNDSQVLCKFDATCVWGFSQMITDCASGAPDCWSTYPPEGSTTDLNEFTVDLPAGSTLCDPPADQSVLNSFCSGRWSQYSAQINESCTSQTDRNEGGTTCCVNCPPPSPGLAAADAGSGSDTTSVCSDEDN